MVKTFRIALANVRFPSTPEQSVTLAVEAIAQAAIERASLICFPECFVPGYRGPGKSVPPPDPAFLERAWSAIAAAAQEANLTVVLGTERVVNHALLATALVINSDGTIAGFQDKVQLDPSEDGLYSPGSERRVFQTGPLTFGVVICHEGWRYPETARSSVRLCLCAYTLRFPESKLDILSARRTLNGLRQTHFVAPPALQPRHKPDMHHPSRIGRLLSCQQNGGRIHKGARVSDLIYRPPKPASNTAPRLQTI